MTNLFGPRTKDAGHSLANAAQTGSNDGRGGHPKPSPGGKPPHDYYGLEAQAEAEAAGEVNLAEHVGEDRPGLDRAIAELVGLVVWLTSVVEDALVKVSAADHKRQSYHGLSPKDRRQPWPGWVRLPLGLMAVGTGAALTGALLQLTADDPYFVWSFSLSVGLAVVVLGVVVAHLARDFEYGFTQGRLPKAILAISGSFAVSLMVALAVIRGTAAEADAERQGGSDGGLTVMLPDQPVTENQATTEDIEENSFPTVPAYAYGLLEGVLFMAAFGVEYINYLPWAKEEKRAVKALAAAESELHDGKAQLAPACGQLMGAQDERADRDASALIVGEAALTHVTAVDSAYRRALAAQRPSSQGGDPFREVDLPPQAAVLGISNSTGNGNTPESVTRQVADRWGRDLQPSGLISDAAYDEMEIDQLAPTALARGLAMLAKVPQRAEFTPVTWDPASLTSPAPLGVKPARPRNGNTIRKPNRNADRRNRGARK